MVTGRQMRLICAVVMHRQPRGAGRPAWFSLGMLAARLGFGSAPQLGAESTCSSIGFMLLHAVIQPSEDGTW